MEIIKSLLIHMNTHQSIDLTNKKKNSINSTTRDIDR